MNDPGADAPDEEAWFETDADGSRGTGRALAAIFQSYADVLREAPDDARYDFDVTVDEVRR